VQWLQGSDAFRPDASTVRTEYPVVDLDFWAQCTLLFTERLNCVNKIGQKENSPERKAQGSVLLNPARSKTTLVTLTLRMMAKARPMF
jgi:hypothetical protein